MESTKIDKKLETNSTDYLVSALKGVLGVIPAGSVIGELLQVIPNQRMDRLIEFTKIMNNKLSTIEQDLFRQKALNENFSMLLEEAITKHVISAVSNERKEYIASLIVNSLSLEDLELLASKHLLKLLGEINDAEVIWLRFYLDPSYGDREFRNKHKDVLEYISPLSSLQQTRDNFAVQNSYKEHLVQLGLLKRVYEIEEIYMESIVRVPKIDLFTKDLKIHNYEITDLGKLLLKYINLTLNKAI